MTETPISIFIYNRPEKTKRVFNRISKAKPKKLMVIADGPKQNSIEDEEKCNEARRIFEQIEWPCQIFRNYADNNLGCFKRVISGLDWIFESNESAIILEDDCVPDQTFFPFCEELLDYYKDDERVSLIHGTNPTCKINNNFHSYCFSQIHQLWGWATWKRSWRNRDMTMRNWPTVRQQGLLEIIFGDAERAMKWTRTFNEIYSKEEAWDFVWFFN